MSSLRLSCPFCQSAVPATEDQRGQLTGCPSCGATLRIPEAPWFYEKNGTRHGPVSRRRLRELLAQGTLQASDLVRQHGTQRWILIADALDPVLTQDASDSETLPREQ
jgi:hypothetical protein